MERDQIRRGVRRGVLRPVLIAVAGLGLLAGGGVGLTHTSLFSAKTITVKGASHLTRSQVVRLAGVGPSTNVFYLDTATVQAQLVKDPWIVGAVVSRHLPSTVDITVREARPVAISSNVDAPVLLAQDGTSLGAVPPGTRLPVVGSAGEGTVRDATTVLGAMPRLFLPKVATADVAVDATVTLTLRDGVTVTFGSASDATRKVEALRAVLAWARRQPIGVVSIDVSSPAVPTARLRGTTAATAVAPPSPTPSSPTPSP